MVMELKDSQAKHGEGRTMPLEIDLNEAPIASPREALASENREGPFGDVAGTAAERGEGTRTRSRVGLLDINAAPPCEMETRDGGELVDSRMHSVCDTSFIRNPFSAPVTCSNVFYLGNGFDPLKAFGSVRHIAKSGFEDVQQRFKFDGNLNDTDRSSIFKGRFCTSDDITLNSPFQNQNDICLQALRKFINEKHGVLGDGWHVEFVYCQKRCKTFAVYCGPDGNRFESMFDVACHLGLILNCRSGESPVRSDEFSLVQRGLHLHNQRKEPLVFPSINNLKECQEILKNSFSGEFLTNTETMNTQASKLKSNVEVRKPSSEKSDCSGSLQFRDGFPVQFDDFCVLSVGEVDPRPSYHNCSEIWPVGYRSSWHDKITGSLFVCDVSDGGESGPVFKVQRFPCSTQSIPMGSVVLFRSSSSSGPYDGKGKTESNIPAACYMDDYEDTNIQMILSDCSPPELESDVLSCSRNDSNEVSNFQAPNSLQTESIRLSTNPGKPAPNGLGLGNNIGEFLVEGASSSSVWRMASQTLIHACREVYKKSGLCNFFCEHNVHGVFSSSLVPETAEAANPSDLLAKFCYLSGPVNIPYCIESNNDLGTFCDAVSKWLDGDRFGLDIDFVQELIERLSGVRACSEYQLLSRRRDNSSVQTVGSGFLLAKRKSDIQGEKETEGLFKGYKRPRKEVDNSPLMKDRCPPGKPLVSKLPADLIGNVLQCWEFLWRFSEVLGLQEPISFKQLEEGLINPWSNGLDFLGRDEIETREETGNQHANLSGESESPREVAQARLKSNTCTGVALTNTHCSLLKLLLNDLHCKLATFVDPNFDNVESKPKRGRKKDACSSIPDKQTVFNVLPVNEVSWPELARRYMSTVLSVEGNLDCAEVIGRESWKVFNCLQGDDGSLTGVAGMEGDALLLAEATKQVFGSVKNITENPRADSNDSDTHFACKKVSDGEIPEWAQALEPVRKLPTNVGARIRKCVYDALNKGPPDWAKEILEHSISKEVYKGNASGPTKRAVISLLAQVCGENLPQQKPVRKKKNKCVNTISDVVMKQCRNVLRRVAAADEERVFCNLLGRTLLNSFDNDNEGLLGSPATISRPLDFRTIDLRLAFGAYGGSHEAFVEDVREVWNNIRTAYGDQSDLVELAETLSKNFEELYEKEVLSLVQKLMDYVNTESLSPEAKKEMEDLHQSASEIPKAPWDEGICKVCGVDKDDDNVLLCDSCDSEYHTYCLNPPLARIPEGNWYCPACAAGRCITQGSVQSFQTFGRVRRKRFQGEFSRKAMEALSHLATTMEMKDYWEYSVSERVFLLKFLCDDVLNSAVIREHLEQCASISADLQQKLRQLSAERKILGYKEELLNAKLVKANMSVPNGVGKSGTQGIAMGLSESGTLMGQPFNRISSNSIPLEDSLHWHKTNFSSEQIVRTSSTECQVTQQPGHITSDTIGTYMAEHTHSPSLNSENTFPGHHCVFQAEVDESQVCHLEASLLKKEISALHDSIAILESQLQKVSVRKDFLGKDSSGRLYWAFSRPGTSPWMVVDGTVPMQLKIIEGKEYEKNPLASSSTTTYSSPFGAENFLSSRGLNVSGQNVHDWNDGISRSSSWLSFESDTEIDKLIGWLRESIPRETELLDSILQCQKKGSKDPITAENFVQKGCQMPSLKPMNSELATKAATLLEKKYGTCLEPDANCIIQRQSWKSNLTCKLRMYRCGCLEPIWPTRCHCPSCHLSFSTSSEFEEHNDKICSSGAATTENTKMHVNAVRGKEIIMTETSRGKCSDEKGMVRAPGSFRHRIDFDFTGLKFQKEPGCPYDFEEICTKFITKSSNKELVREIGLLGSNGIPSLVPSTSSYLTDPTLFLVHSCDNGVNENYGLTNWENLLQSVQGNAKTSMNPDNFLDDSLRRCAENGNYEEALKREGSNLDCTNKRDLSSSLKNLNLESGGGKRFIARETSMRPVVGRVSDILRRCKINLLDMDAALPADALKPSKTCLEKRYAWRAYVKSAKSIFEMVQATIVLENMIKTDYLRKGWWYGSSLSAAAKISTISSLALRIYTLDAAIVYEEPLPNSGPTEVIELDGKSENPASPSDPTNDNPMQSNKPDQMSSSPELTEKSKPKSKTSKRKKDFRG